MDILSTLIGFFIGAALAAGLLVARLIQSERQNAALTMQVKSEKAALETASAALDMRFKATAQEALSQSGERFLQLAQEKLAASQKDGAHDLDKRQKAIDALIKPVQDHLKLLADAVEQSKGTDQALREDLKSLSRETARLVGALRDPAAQGRWGEYILEGLLEKSGLMKGVHYHMQVNMQSADGARQRPDAVIDMQDGFKIIIDAKAPVNEFVQRLSEDLNEEQYKELMNALARQIKLHIQKLGAKNYWQQAEGADFTVLFLPSEHLYSMALRAQPDLVDTAMANNIIIASPTLLMSLLRVVSMSWRQIELAKNAQDISALGSELYERIATFTGHMDSVGKGLERASAGYNRALASLESRVLVSARKLKDLHAAPQGKTIESPATLEITQKALSADEAA